MVFCFIKFSDDRNNLEKQGKILVFLVKNFWVSKPRKPKKMVLMSHPFYIKTLELAQNCTITKVRNAKDYRSPFLSSCWAQFELILMWDSWSTSALEIFPSLFLSAFMNISSSVTSPQPLDLASKNVDELIDIKRFGLGGMILTYFSIKHFASRRFGEQSH